MNRFPFVVLVISLLLATGCTLSPEYRRPDAPVPSEWPGGATYRGGERVTHAPRAWELSWRDLFTDKRLQRIIETALENNRDLRSAALNVQRARALYGIQRAELAPSLNAAGSGSRQRVPADLSSTGKAVITERYSVDFGVSAWEIDFFGRLRSLKKAALEEYLATEQARRSARILLISEIANTYLSLAADRERLRTAASALESRQEAYRMMKRLRDLGLASELDLRRAQTQVDAARGDKARLAQQVARDKNALNLLIGTPSAIPNADLPEDLADISPSKEVSRGIPSEVLLRRPDIMAKEHRLKAANADIGAARAAFFPRIALTGTLGTASRELRGLFEDGSATWSFAPRIVMPVFDARLWSAYGASKVEREIARTEYEKGIQTAFREVADALAVRGTVQEQLSAQQSLVEALDEALRLSDVLYRKGLDSYLGVLDAQRSLYEAEQGLIGVRLEKRVNRVRLYAVLGGGGGDDDRP